LGVPPNFAGGFLNRPVRLVISGVTKDSTLVAIPSAVVDLFRTADNSLADSVVSDANGLYVASDVGPAQNYYGVGYKPGSPDTTGATLNTLTGVEG